MVTELTRRIRPGSDPGEPVQIEEMHFCECPFCDFHIDEEMHWFPIGKEMDKDTAEKIVRNHNNILQRI